MGSSKYYSEYMRNRYGLSDKGKKRAELELNSGRGVEWDAVREQWVPVATGVVSSEARLDGEFNKLLKEIETAEINTPEGLAAYRAFAAAITTPILQKNDEEPFSDKEATKDQPTGPLTVPTRRDYIVEDEDATMNIGFSGPTGFLNAQPIEHSSSTVDEASGVEPSTEEETYGDDYDLDSLGEDLYEEEPYSDDVKYDPGYPTTKPSNKTVEVTNNKSGDSIIATTGRVSSNKPNYGYNNVINTYRYNYGDQGPRKEREKPYSNMIYVSKSNQVFRITKPVKKKKSIEKNAYKNKKAMKYPCLNFVTKSYFIKLTKQLPTTVTVLAKPKSKDAIHIRQTGTLAVINTAGGGGTGYGYHIYFTHVKAKPGLDLVAVLRDNDTNGGYFLSINYLHGLLKSGNYHIG
jgi:hypothetical protein